MEKFVMSAGSAVRYSDFGKGKKVICLLHGYLEAMEVWDSFAGGLGKEYRVIALDLPGHGFSEYGKRESVTIDFMAEVVAGVLEKAGVERCCVVGHSMGGYVAAAVAELFPDKVEKLIFFHSTPAADSDQKKEYRKREIELIRAGKKELLATLNPEKGFAPQNVKRCAEAIDELAEQVMMTQDEAIVAVLNGMMQRRDRTEFVSKLEIPVLFIFGRFDNHIPLAAAEKVIESVPNAQIAWLENSGHTGFTEEPEAAMDIVRAFV
ncbi:alpha/beta hydrolase fold [Mucinivorans hirudinis]|uniref:Alpha/beta hydrolase fold n=1 Tax=Mucinivorans hirudinis TaxID=1433126 RepID=A0A060R8W4_9BACT|nr:alpha/beta hydrolase fold [Mucinivorans hirudinis]